jgi:hypothetical protein
MFPAVHDDKLFSEVLEHGMCYLEEEQLPSGELPNFRMLARGGWEYCFSPLPSAYVHDVLAYFDPLSFCFDPQAVEQVQPSSRNAFIRSVLRVRRSALRFLAWQQNADLSWRFFGLGSAVPADADLTTIAATALVEARGRDRARDWSRQTTRIRSFRGEDGLYGDATSRGDISPVSATLLRLIASSNVLRYYALVGEHSESLKSLLEHEVRHCTLESGCPVFLWAFTRACRHAHLPSADTLQRHITAGLLECQDSSGDFGGPLSTALAMHSLLDLQYEGAELRAGREALLNWLDPVHGRRFEAFGHSSSGSCALTTVLITTALARGGRYFHV